MRLSPPLGSRRTVLAAALCATASVAVGGVNRAFAEKAKLSRADVAYRDTPNGNERC